MFCETLIILGSSAPGRCRKGGLKLMKDNMKKYVAISGNTEIVYYSSHRLGSKGNKEDMEREIRKSYSVRDARELLNSIDCVMRDNRD